MESPKKFVRQFPLDEPLVDYDALFKKPILPPDPPVPRRNFFYRTRNSLWWIAVFLVISITVLASMKSNFIIGDEAESGCGDDGWSFLYPSWFR
jgi:hypothetical protein